MSMYISLVAVAIRVSYTREFQELFEATVYIQSQCKLTAVSVT